MLYIYFFFPGKGLWLKKKTENFEQHIKLSLRAGIVDNHTNTVCQGGRPITLSNAHYLKLSPAKQSAATYLSNLAITEHSRLKLLSAKSVSESRMIEFISFCVRLVWV